MLTLILATLLFGSSFVITILAISVLVAGLFHLVSGTVQVTDEFLRKELRQQLWILYKILVVVVAVSFISAALIAHFAGA